MHIPLQVAEWVNTEYDSLQFRNLSFQLLHQPTNARNKFMRSIKLLHVSAPGAILRQFFFYIDLTMPTHLQDDIATDHVRARQMFVSVLHAG